MSTEIKNKVIAKIVTTEDFIEICQRVKTEIEDPDLSKDDYATNIKSMKK